MRSLMLLPWSLALLVAGCAPTVELPEGNEQITSEAPPTELPAPSVQPVPGKYPYAKLAIRGTAANATRVIVEGSGNPASGSVQPVDNSFCVVVDLTVAPATYTLELRSQGGDGRLSTPVNVEVDRANDAPPPPDAKLCDGTPAGG